MGRFKIASDAQGDRFEVSAHLGDLVYIEVISHETGIRTTYNADADAIKCNITVLDGADAGSVYEKTLLFQGVLIATLDEFIGDEFLGRIGQSATSKPGQNPSFIFLNPSTEDVELAESALGGEETQSVVPETQSAPAKTQKNSARTQSSAVKTAAEAPSKADALRARLSSR